MRRLALTFLLGCGPTAATPAAPATAAGAPQTVDPIGAAPVVGHVTCSRLQACIDTLDGLVGATAETKSQRMIRKLGTGGIGEASVLVLDHEGELWPVLALQADDPLAALSAARGAGVVFERTAADSYTLGRLSVRVTPTHLLVGTEGALLSAVTVPEGLGSGDVLVAALGLSDLEDATRRGLVEAVEARIEGAEEDSLTDVLKRSNRLGWIVEALENGQQIDGALRRVSEDMEIEIRVEPAEDTWLREYADANAVLTSRAAAVVDRSASVRLVNREITWFSAEERADLAELDQIARGAIMVFAESELPSAMREDAVALATRLLDVLLDVPEDPIDIDFAAVMRPGRPSGGLEVVVTGWDPEAVRRLLDDAANFLERHPVPGVRRTNRRNGVIEVEFEIEGGATRVFGRKATLAVDMRDGYVIAVFGERARRRVLELKRALGEVEPIAVPMLEVDVDFVAAVASLSETDPGPPAHPLTARYTTRVQGNAIVRTVTVPADLMSRLEDWEATRSWLPEATPG